MNDSRAPMYQTIVDDVKNKIMRGEFKPNAYLGTQIDLAKIYGTSEITSRRALAELTDLGYVYRVKGKGTFISDIVREPETEFKASTARRQEISQVYLVSDFLNEMNFVVNGEDAILRSVLNNRFYIETLRSIRHECERLNLPLRIIPKITKQLTEDPNAGFIYMLPVIDQAAFLPLIDTNHASVTIHGYYPHLSIPYVIADNMTGGYLATHHLITEGHKDIAVVLTGTTMMKTNQEFMLRFQGYKLAMEQHRLPIKDEYVIFMEKDDENAGFVAMETLLKLKEPPTAVFFSTDIKALGASYSLLINNVSVPGDMSIIGYDDQYFSENLYPALTTINQNADKIGLRALRLLLEHAKTTTFIKEEVVPTLIVRETVGPPRRK